MLKRRREYDCTTGSDECNKPHDLVDTLEEHFGYLNTSDQGVWSELSKEIASKLSKSVFAIASFNGNFYCPVFLCPASLHHQIQLQSGSKVVAVGCLFNSRKLMATSGIVMDKVSRFDSEEFLISTCKISKAGTGGPLVDFNGNFLGMNLPQNKQGGGCTSDIMVRSTDNGVYLYANSYFNPEVPIDTVHKKLRSLGYPVPEKNCGGMKLINRFEEKFPYVDGSCRSVLKDLSEEVALNLSCSVVSLASFNGNTRLFACTGILIECTSVLTCASLVSLLMMKIRLMMT
ncbi:hypothetical protein ACQ4PT_038672 [Festuca glaucescens]